MRTEDLLKNALSLAKDFCRKTINRIWFNMPNEAFRPLSDAKFINEFCMQTLANAKWITLRVSSTALITGRWLSTTWLKLTLLKCAMMTNILSFKKLLTSAYNVSSEIDKYLTWWKRNHTHPLFASIKMKKWLEYSHLAAWFHTNDSHSW